MVRQTLSGTCEALVARAVVCRYGYHELSEAFLTASRTSESKGASTAISSVLPPAVVWLSSQLTRCTDTPHHHTSDLGASWSLSFLVATPSKRKTMPITMAMTGDHKSQPTTTLGSSVALVIATAIASIQTVVST